MGNALVAAEEPVFQDYNYISVLARKLAILVLVLLPFQRLPQELFRDGSFKYLSYLDEFSFALFFGMTLTFHLLKPRAFQFPALPWIGRFLLIFMAYGGLAGIIKGVPPGQALFGVYDAVKNLWVLFPFAWLRLSREEFLRAVKAVTTVCLILALAGIVTEILAVSYDWGIGLFVSEEKRLGLHRAASLTGPGSPNYLGIYAILAFFLLQADKSRSSGRRFQMGLILVLLVLTLSRQTWLCFLAMLALMNRRFIIPSLVLAVSVVWLFSLMPDEGMLLLGGSFRNFALDRSLDILAEHPLTGLGAGMYGSMASFLWESPAYDLWPPIFRASAFNLASLDQFWPTIWAEYGLIGLALYGGIWLAMMLALRKGAARFQAAGDVRLYGLGRTLQYAIVVLVIMGTVSGLNEAFVVFTYFGLVGAYLSLAERTA